MNRTALFVDTVVIIAAYSAWLMLVLYGNNLPIWLLFILAGYVCCVHGSIQHIAVHGHPTQHSWLNTLLVYPPLALYFPFQIYKESHLQHHQCEMLTDVETDPESLYLTREHWNRLNPVSRLIYRINFTLAGRLIIGPFVSLYQLWKNEFHIVLSGNRRRALIWGMHGVGCTAVLAFVSLIGNMPIWKYLVCFAYPGIALTLLRSYTEHRWSMSASERTIIIEGSWISRLLYLNNNYHWVHHENPRLPWTRVPEVFRRRREEILQQNGNFYIKGYHQVFTRLWKDKLIDPIHPTFIQNEKFSKVVQ